MPKKVSPVKPRRANPRFEGIRRALCAPALIVAGAVLLAGQSPQSDRLLAITIDDLPGVARGGTLADFQAMNRAMVSVLEAERVPAIGFVNEGKLEVEGEHDARVALLDTWLDAGMTLGNHTFSHRGLTNTPVEEYERDVLRGEVVTRRLLEARQQPLEFFRHPMTQTGPTVEVKQRFDAFLADHGYRTAPFTIEDSDYIFALLFDIATNAGDAAQADRVLAAYHEHQLRMFEWFELLSRETFGREIPQVLLIHVNRLHAAGLARELATMTRRGYRFVPLEAVMADPAYDTADGFVGRFGPSWLHRWRVTLDMSNRLRDEPDPPQWVLDEYNRLTGG